LSERSWNILFRTIHIGVTGVLVGGHVFNIDHERLLPWLYATIISGTCLAVVEAYPKLHWFYQVRGMAVILKLLLLCLIPFMWDSRVPILVVVIVIACIGSHMPGKYRYYSFVHGRILEGSRRG